MEKKKRKNLIRLFIDFIDDETILPRIRYLNFVLCVVMVASALCIIPMILYHTDGIIFNVILSLSCFIAELVYVEYKKVDLSAFLITSFCIFYILPSMYFSAGGIHSAMPIWFVLVTLLSYIVCSDKIKFLMFFCCLLSGLICITVELVYPESVSPLNGDMAIVTDIIFGMIIISFLLLFVFRVIENTEAKQRATLERQKEELIDKQRKLEIAYNNDRTEWLVQSKKTLEEYYEIIAHAGMGIWYIDLVTDKLPKMRANDKMLEILNVGNQQLNEEELYNYWNSRIADSDRTLVEKCVDEIIYGKTSEITYQWIDDEKGVTYVRCGGSAIHNDDGSITLRGYHSDVTDIVQEDQRHKKELALAREKAEAANKSKSTFLFNMSHDIRTPMNAISGFTHLMENNLNNPEQLANYLKKVEDSSSYLLSIINNILDMAQIDSGKMSLEENKVDILNEKYSISSIFSNELENKRLQFTEQFDIQHQFVYADIQKIYQILMNLISNSIKYTPVDGNIRHECIEIECEKQGYATFKTIVSDDGIGMSEEYLETIFESFSRERSTTESKIIGTGLGMSIVKKLVEFMGFTINVESEPNKGSTFTIIHTHRIADDENVDSNNVSDVTDIDFSEKRILLAEDNELNAEIVITILENIGIHADHAQDGIQCVEILEQHDAGYYDLILMDIQMPNMNGYEASKKIRGLEDTIKANIPIIACTANAFEEDKKNASEAGMNGHISKPIEVKTLISVLSQTFNL